ncbi:ABC transporter substrate-binding protein [Agromyces subbeticus]|uniref:ABC transporter substrate-binding protein n=1 Tax=Agromyces subbeticus TaxID=293890 RepID=UPI0003B6C81A|nr:ABC transporter substrate-binding protein [Agromyces subbeticus]
MNISHRPRRAAWLAIAAGAAIALTGCTADGGDPSTAPAIDIPFGATTPAASGPVDSVAWMLPAEPATFDFDIDSGAAENTVFANVCERLMAVQPDLTTVPHLAESAEWVDDTHVVFTIRTDATFHDGSPVTADDVLWSMQRHAAEGADESDEYANVTAMEKTGANEITVTLAQRDAIFIQAMAGNGGMVLNPRVVEAQGENFGAPGTPDACSGPYTLGEWKPGTSLTIEKAENYWDASREVLASEVVFRWADQSAVVNALTAGEADGSYLDSPASAIPLQSVDSVSLAQGPSTNAWVLLATERGALADERIRQALSLALDRAGIAKAAFGDLAEPSKTPIGSGAWGYERDAFEAAYEALEGAPASPSASDLEAAKELVAEAGAPDEPIVIASDGGSVRNVVSNALVAAAKSIGLEAEIATIPSAQYGDFYSDAELRGQADLFSDEYYISKNDPVGFYKNGASTASVNFVGFDDPEYDELVTQAFAATDDAERAELAIELQRRWVEATPWLPVTQSPSTVAYSSKLTGLPSSAAYLYYPWAADLGSSQG